MRLGALTPTAAHQNNSAELAGLLPACLPPGRRGRGKTVREGSDGLGDVGVGLRGSPGRGPAADDVTHRQQSDDIRSLDDYQVPEAAVDHRRRGSLHGPVACGEHDVLRAVVSSDLGIRALAATY